jgi:hypothetical protein
MAASREPGTRASAPTRGRGGWRGRAAKAAVSVLPLLFTAAAFLSESPLEPFGPGHARRFSAAPGFDQRFTDFSDRSGPPGRSAGSADASDCRTPRHRLALLRRRPRVRGSAREDSRSDPAGPAGSSPLPGPATPACLPFQTSGTSPHEADAIRLDESVVG